MMTGTPAFLAIGRGFRSGRRGRQALDRLLDLVEGRPDVAVERLPRELDRDRRRVALHVGEDRRLDAEEVALLGLATALDRRGDRADEAVGEQHAHEGPDEGAADE